MLSATDAAVTTTPPVDTTDLSVVIPAYNEADCIGETINATVAELRRLGCSFEIVVVDDGSRDTTYRTALEAAARHADTAGGAVRVVTYTRNGGKGYAVKYGASQTVGRFVAFLDADLELHPRLLGRLCAVQRRTGADIVIGSKRHPESVIDYPAERKVYSTVYYYLCRLLFGLPVRDTQTGIKLVRGSFARDVLPRLRVNRYAYDLEMLAVAHDIGLRIAEAPIELAFNRRFRRIGASDIRRICVDTLAIWWRLRVAAAMSRRSGRGARHRGEQSPVPPLERVG